MKLNENISITNEIFNIASAVSKKLIHLRETTPNTKCVYVELNDYIYNSSNIIKYTLADVTVGYAPLNSRYTFRGSFFPNKKFILVNYFEQHFSISSGKVINPNGILSTIIHEMRHAINYTMSNAKLKKVKDFKEDPEQYFNSVEEVSSRIEQALHDLRNEFNSIYVNGKYDKNKLKSTIFEIGYFRKLCYPDASMETTKRYLRRMYQYFYSLIPTK